MKILITTDTFTPVVNGVVTSTINLYKELKSQGHDVKIITLSNNSETYIDGDVYYLKSKPIWVYPEARRATFSITSNNLIKEITDWKPDIIHSQSEFSTMIIARKITKATGIPLVHTYHTMYEDYLSYFLKGKVINRDRAAKITKMLLDKVNMVIAPTDKTKNALINYGVDAPIKVIPTGIDLSRFMVDFSENEKMNLRESVGINKEDKVLAYIGRIAQEKNIEEVIENFKYIVDVEKRAKLLIVGGGPYLDVLKEEATNFNLLDNIIFTGMVKPEDVYKYYKISDVFVTASTSETQGLTYIEALSCGTPVVCRYDQCIEEVVIDGYNGYTYNKGKDFVSSTLKLLRDDDLRKKFSSNALSKSYEYSSELFGIRVYELYKEVYEHSVDIDLLAAR